MYNNQNQQPPQQYGQQPPQQQQYAQPQGPQLQQFAVIPYSNTVTMEGQIFPSQDMPQGSKWATFGNGGQVNINMKVRKETSWQGQQKLKIRMVRVTSSVNNLSQLQPGQVIRVTGELEIVNYQKKDVQGQPLKDITGADVWGQIVQIKLPRDNMLNGKPAFEILGVAPIIQEQNTKASSPQHNGGQQAPQGQYNPQGNYQQQAPVQQPPQQNYQQQPQQGYQQPPQGYAPPQQQGYAPPQQGYAPPQQQQNYQPPAQQAQQYAGPPPNNGGPAGQFAPQGGTPPYQNPPQQQQGAPGGTPPQSPIPF
jgi:hypothetical protein